MEVRMASIELEHPEIPDWGVDLPIARRPGVPREASPRPYPGARWVQPEQQVPTVPILKRADLPGLTPTFGTGAPPRGLSGRLRRLAYKSPDHLVRHWMILLAADRVDAIEGRLDGILQRAQPSKALASKARAWVTQQRLSSRRFRPA
jgi:hypothetical protein